MGDHQQGSGFLQYHAGTVTGAAAASLRAPFSGSIEVILGPMFASKTTELFARLRRYECARKSCILIKYDKDVRYNSPVISTQGDAAVTHDLSRYPATSTSLLEHVEALAKTYDVVGIDEGQFFPDIVEFSDRMANRGHIIVVAALDGDFLRHGFNEIPALISRAERVYKLSAVCMRCCRKDAAFTLRLTNETGLEVIGGKEMYAAACRPCYFGFLQEAANKARA